MKQQASSYYLLIQQEVVQQKASSLFLVFAPLVNGIINELTSVAPRPALVPIPDQNLPSACSAPSLEKNKPPPGGPKLLCSGLKTLTVYKDGQQFPRWRAASQVLNLSASILLDVTN